MSDLKQRLRKLDLAQAPDVWPDASSRMVARSADLDQERRPRRSRIATAVVALAVFAAAGLFARNAFQTKEPPSPVATSTVSPTPATTIGPLVMALEYGGGWRIAETSGSGTDVTWLTGTQMSVAKPFPARDVALSSDGKLLAFMGFAALGSPNYIYVGPVGSGDWQPITQTVGGEHPSWSPDGRHLAFDGGGSVFTVNVDGSNLQEIARGLQPSWSPDGRTIAFASIDDGGIVLYDVASGHVNNITTDPDLWPAFSPSGSQIAFVRGPRTNYRVYVMDADGSNVRPLTDCAAGVGDCDVPEQTWPVWDPNRPAIAYVSAGDIVEASTDGTVIGRVSLSTNGAQSFAWLQTDGSVNGTSTPTPVPAGAFIPQTSEAPSDRIMLGMTFPDGTVATIEYDASMQVAALGARPYWGGGGDCVAAYYRDGLPPELEGAEPIRTWEQDGRTVTLIESKVEGFGQTFVLLFDVSPWVLAVSDPATGIAPSDQLLACVPVVQASVTEDGWVVREDVALHSDWGPPFGPWIEFGSLAPERRRLIAWPGPCEPFGNSTLDGVSIALHDDSATWCDPGGMMRFTAYFEPDSTFPEDVIRGLDVLSVQLAVAE